jgi:cobalt-zinc-cadmium efflux system outer membrane protein
LAQADLLDAGLLRNPNIQLLLPTTTKPFELFGQFAVEQFWQRPRRISAAKKQWDQVAQALLQNGLNTVRDTRQAHAALLQAQVRSRIAAESADLRQQIAKITQARLRAGDVSALDARASEADAADAIEQLHRLEHDVEIARQRLRFVAGLSPGPALRAMASPLNQSAPPPEDALREQAWSSRPDLRALEIGIAAAAERGRWERSRLLTLGALLSSKRFLNNDILTGPGLSFDIPIFRSNAGGVARADAQVEQATRQYLAQRQRVDLEVSESRAALLQALDSLRDWRERVLPPAAAAVEGSKSALEAGDASNLFVLEMTRQYVDAQLREADQEAAVRRSWAELERSVGTRIGGAQ